MEELRCLVCQGQSIADLDAELAGDMRDLVRRRIAAGEQPAAFRSLADPALRQLDQLPAHRRAGRMAAVARAHLAADHRRVPHPPADPVEARADGLDRSCFCCSPPALPGCGCSGLRGAPATAAAAALLLGASGYAFQGRPDLPAARREAERGRDSLPLTKPARPSSANSRRRKAGSKCRKPWRAPAISKMPSESSKMRCAATRRPAIVDRPRQCSWSIRPGA